MHANYSMHAFQTLIKGPKHLETGRLSSQRPAALPAHVLRERTARNCCAHRPGSPAGSECPSMLGPTPEGKGPVGRGAASCIPATPTSVAQPKSCECCPHVHRGRLWLSGQMTTLPGINNDTYTETAFATTPCKLWTHKCSLLSMKQTMARMA